MCAVAVVAALAAPGAANATTYAGKNGLIAFTRFVGSTPGAQIWTVDPTSHAMVDISKRHYGDDQPEFAPNGKLIVFRGSGSLFTMTPTGGSRHDLIADPQGSFANPKWSPDAKHIVYENNGDIGIMNAGGSGEHLITNTGDDHDPEWSPDGTLIAFTSYRDNDQVRIFVMDSDGENAHDLSSVTDPSLTYLDSEASWAPDSQHLLFTSTRSAGGNQIFEMSRDGSSVEPMTDAFDGANDPAYSPDGSAITYTAGNGEGQTAVFTQPNGSFGTPITTTPENSIGAQLSWQAKVKTTLAVSPANGGAGTTFRVTVSGFGLGEPVAVSFVDGGVTTKLGAVTTDATGSARKKFTVPAGAAGGSATVRATGNQTGRTATADFTVVPPP